MPTFKHLSTTNSALTQIIYQMNNRIYTYKRIYTNITQINNTIKDYANNIMLSLKYEATRINDYLILDGHNNLVFIEKKVNVELDEQLKYINKELRRDFNKVFNTYRNTIKDIIKDFNTEMLSRQEMKVAMFRRADILKSRILTILNTFEISIYNLAVLYELNLQTLTPDDTLLLFAGGEPVRPFCRVYWNKIARYGFWKSLDNGHGLPVISNLGGYNCKHR